MRFVKLHSIGNDFVLVFEDELGHTEPSALAIDLCRRHYSIGADGLLVLGRQSDGLFLRMFNPDGTEDFCGNGLRCATRLALEQGWFHDETVVKHLGREVPVRVLPSGRIQTTLGTASADSKDVPLARQPVVNETITVGGHHYTATALSTGSTHLVLFVSELPADDEFLSVSHALGNHPWFPERTSVMWTKVEAEDVLRLRIWERGAGETLGCGTGSAAAAAAYLLQQGRGGRITVLNPGGEVTMSMA
nr:diaminopimelate epimerase [Fimbriimonadaceae bacterium]